jgi:uncharacterized membrane protein
MSDRRLRRLVSFGFVGIGTLHFLQPKLFEAIVPEGIPAKEAVAISGAAEIAGGIGIAIPQTRRAARWGLLALLLAVYPANINMAVNPEATQAKGVPPMPAWALWGRLPFQAMFAWAVVRATR